MDEWGVFLVLVAVAGLFITVGSPILKLNTTLTMQSALLSSLDEKLDELSDDKKEAHKRLWAHNEKQDKRLDDHEKRIISLEDFNKLKGE